MDFFPYLIAVMGNILIGTGQCLQKYGLNSITINNTSLPVSRITKPHSSTPLIKIEKPSFFARFKSRPWVCGIIANYFGEFFGNWIALSYLSASSVTPLGAVAVITNAMLAERFLKEKISSFQRKGYAILLLGVFIILSVAPAPSRASELLDQVDASFSERGGFIFGAIFVVELVLLYIRYVHKYERLWLAVSIPALFGGSTVLSSKVVSMLIRNILLQTREVITKRSKESDTNEDRVTYQEIWNSLLQTRSADTFFIALLLLCFSLVSQEYFKQIALSKYPTVEFQPLYYALFNVAAAIGGVYLFKELKEYPYIFYSGFILGLCFLWAGTRLLQHPSIVMGTKLR